MPALEHSRLHNLQQILNATIKHRNNLGGQIQRQRRSRFVITPGQAGEDRGRHTRLSRQ